MVQNSSDSSFVGFSEYGYDIRNNLTKLITNYGGKANKQQYFYSAVDESSKSGDYAKDNLPTMYKLNDECYALYAYASLNRYNERKLVLGANTNLYYNYVYRLSDRNASGESKYRTTQVEEEYIGNDVYIYGYDVLGNITSIKTATRSGTANETSHSEAQDYVTYSYDKLGQLKRENLVGKNTTVWDYDDLGNITAKNEYAYTTDVDLAGKTATKTVTYYYKEDDIPYEIEPETTKTYSSWNNLLLAVNLDGSEKVSNDELIEYDEIGNPKKYLGASLSWNGRQLTSYSTDDKTITYTYDSNGLRTSKTIKNGVKSEYFYVNGQLHYEERSNGTKLYFFYDSNGYLTGIEYNNTMYYPATNLKGDVVGIYNNLGEYIAKYEYDAWGKVIAVTDANDVEITDQTHIAHINPIRYRGYYYDSETKWYYLQSRYYNPEVGRFLNSDSISDSGAGVLGFNTFIYCANNPVNATDPSGHFVISAFLAKIGISALVGGVIGAIGEIGCQVMEKGKVYDGVAVAKSAIIGGVCGAISGGIGEAIAKTAASATAKFVAGAIADGCVNVIESSLNAICNNETMSVGNYAYSFASGVASAGVGEIVSSKTISFNSKNINTMTPGQRRSALYSQNTGEVFNRQVLKNDKYMSSTAYEQYINKGSDAGKEITSGASTLFFCFFEEETM